MPQRRLIVTQNLTANGIIEFAEPWFDPGEQGEFDDILAVTRAQSEAEGDLLLGRKTFEEFRGYWPLQTDDETGITDHLNQVSKHVVSSTLTDPAWENSTVVSDPLLEAVERLKSTGEGELGITGSISVVHELIRADLIDEYRLFVFPVLTSRGRNLVPDGVTMRNVKLSATQSFRSGVVLQTYTRV